MGDWKDLPRDVLIIITNHSNMYTDYVRFRAVCASWRSSLPKLPPKHFCYDKIPWLMLPYETEKATETDHKLRGLYNTLNVDEVYYLELPEVKDENYGNLRGSFNGWLVILEDGVTLKLMNLLTKSKIQLPPISTLPDIKEYDSTQRKFTIIDHYHPGFTYSLTQHYVHATYIKKIVFNDSIAIAIYGPYSKLVFTKFGDDKWTDIPTSLDCFQDCILFDRKIYAVNRYGRLEVSPIDDPTQMVAFLHSRQHKLVLGTFNLSLVKKGDDLILVERRSNVRKWIFDFNLYKLVSDGWLAMNDLDGYTIFLSRYNASICIPSEYCPNLKEGNRIYFTYDQNERSNNEAFLGVFDFKDRSWRRLLGSDPLNRYVWPHPSLVVLNPNPS